MDPGELEFGNITSSSSLAQNNNGVVALRIEVVLAANFVMINDKTESLPGSFCCLEAIFRWVQEEFFGKAIGTFGGLETLFTELCVHFWDFTTH
jgi:hypothetical protein